MLTATEKEKKILIKYALYKSHILLGTAAQDQILVMVD